MKKWQDRLVQISMGLGAVGVLVSGGALVYAATIKKHCTDAIIRSVAVTLCQEGKPFVCMTGPDDYVQFAEDRVYIKNHCEDLK